MKVISLESAEAKAVKALGLDQEVFDLVSLEALASSLRRAAAFLCPASRTTLIDAVHDALRGIRRESSGDDLRTRISDVLESLIGHGDLLELGNLSQAEADSLQIYRAPPSFVRRESGAVLLLGVPPDDVSPLPVELQDRIEYLEHVRLIMPGLNTHGHLRQDLLDLGLVEIPLKAWLKAPSTTTAAEHLAMMREYLRKVSPCGEVTGLSILDPDTPVKYYRGRWRDPNASHTGCYVARRPQAYGSDLWCYVELNEGRPMRLLDLPARAKPGRGCDYAWRLQAAIDHERGAPQICQIREEPDGTILLGFFSPTPQWARRRWSAIGEPLSQPGTLFSFRISREELAAERKYVDQDLWLEVVL